MEPNWAAENLQTIRTLMERSAVYRRTLAPILLFVGTLGVIAAIGGTVRHLDSMHAFSRLWLGTAGLAVIGAFLIARRQALKESEGFWSPPTRRVAQALLPPFACGMFIGVLCAVVDGGNGFNTILTVLWLLFYGCALNAAGFFMPRGVKLFGWIFLGGTFGFVCLSAATNNDFGINAHWLMGFFFGVLHLAYGIYLYLTEKRKNAA